MAEFFLALAMFFVAAFVVVGGSTALVFRREVAEIWREWREEVSIDSPAKLPADGNSRD